MLVKRLRGNCPTLVHPQVLIRAGIHIGPIRVEAGDVFGGTVNFAARVVGAVQDAEIWLSERAKEDIDRLGAGKHKKLKWQRHAEVAMKGFPGKWTLLSGGVNSCHGSAWSVLLAFPRCARCVLEALRACP